MRHHRHRSRSDSFQKQRRRSSQHRRHYRTHYDDYHHRSRSKDHRSQFYEERRQEEREHKIRLALRNNTLNYDTGLLQSFMCLAETKRTELSEEAHAPQYIHENILVRELYLSGLNDMSQDAIKQFFSQYGNIETVEIIKNFIFVKYYKVQDASNACADYHNINTTLHQSHNPSFKIFYADNLKRVNVVSNHPNYEVREHMIPILYTSVKNDSQYTNQQYLLNIFNRYGFVRNIKIKRNDLPTQRTYVLVEYQNMTMTERARDKLRSQSDKLGDRKSEIAILINNEKAAKIHPNVSHQLRHQKKRQESTNTHPPPPPQHLQPQFQRKETDDIFNMIQQIAHQEEEQHLADWSGFFTRNKQFKVEVDFFSIHKQPLQLDTILNVSHRGDVKEALQRSDYMLAGRFKAAGPSHVDTFNAYIRYFTSKNKTGIIFTKDYLIQIIPPLNDAVLPYQIHNNEMLALFFRINQ